MSDLPDWSETDPEPAFDTAEALRSALALAKNGHAVFPCSSNKTPARPKAEGGNGFHDASKDPNEIEWLWRHWPGPFVGIATGAVSNLAVLDVDGPRHDEARLWWLRHQQRLPRTRTYQTRSGGLHLYFRHAEGLTCSGGKRELTGIDVRCEGGYIISWFAAGYPCLDHVPLAPWPSWLTQAVRPPPEPDPERVQRAIEINPSARIESLLKTVRQAGQGRRNALLYWATCRMKEPITRGDISGSEARRALLEAAIAADLPEAEASRTIGSAMGAAA